MRRQKTIIVEGVKVKMIARSVSSLGNSCGFRVSVNGVDTFCNVLKPQEAFDLAYIRWVERFAVKKG